MRTCRILLPVFAALFFFLWCLKQAGGIQSGGVHTDKKCGFKIQPPRGWEQIPLKVGEKWIVAKYQSDKEYYDFQSEEYKAGWRIPHKPDVKVILFPSDMEKKPKVEVKKEGSNLYYITTLDNPYKNYEDYLSRNFSGGGYYISSDSTKKIRGIDVRQIEIKIEKLTRGGAKRLITWIYHAEVGDFAVEFEVLEYNYKKLKSIVYSSLNSFSIIPIEEDLSPPEEKKEDDIIKPVDSQGNKRELTLNERILIRRKEREAVLEKAKSNLLPEWKVYRTEHFLVISHATDKYTKRVIDQIEAMREWLDKNLDSISEMPAMDGIVRICKDHGEESAYHDASGDLYSSDTGEVTLSEDRDWGREWEFWFLNRGIFQQWLDDKYEGLYFGMPGWLRSGLAHVLGTAMMKGGKKLNFKPDAGEMEQLRIGKHEGKHLPLQELFKCPASKWNSEENWRYYPAQSASVVRYILGPGGRSAKTKDFIPSYLKEVIAAMKKREEEWKKERPAASEAKTEEEEEKAFRERRKKSKEEDTFVLDEAFKTFFKDWTDSDWSALEKGWKAFSK